MYVRSCLVSSLSEAVFSATHKKWPWVTLITRSPTCNNCSCHRNYRIRTWYQQLIDAVVGDLWSILLAFYITYVRTYVRRACLESTPSTIYYRGLQYDFLVFLPCIIFFFFFSGLFPVCFSRSCCFVCAAVIWSSSVSVSSSCSFKKTKKMYALYHLRIPFVWSVLCFVS